MTVRIEKSSTTHEPDRSSLGGLFILLAAGLRVGRAGRWAALLFHYSLVSLALLFVAAALDAALSVSLQG
jgi:heme O synthase-like polyprenyltransferase